MKHDELLKTAKPITFSTGMVQATLDGRKTRTRRVVKPLYHQIGGLPKRVVTNCDFFEFYLPNATKPYYSTLPKYQIGDILYVRETWGIGGFNEDTLEMFITYKVDGSNAGIILPGDKFQKYYESISASEPDWRPSIHMPKEAARIFLRVTGVRVERLQEITPEDCKNEGIIATGVCGELFDFIKLWDSLNAKHDGGIYVWDKNPWVWVYEFERISVSENE